METLKKWGLWIVGAAIFLLTMFAAVGRTKEKPQPPAPQIELPPDYTEKNEKIEEAHVAIVEKTQPVPKSDAASISAAIEEYNKE